MSALLAIIYILIFIIFALVAYAVLQIKLFGMKVKDFWSFIEANQMLDKLSRFANQYENMSPQEQIIYLAEAEKIFKAVIYMCLPLISFYTVEFLNGNLLTEDLKAYQIALNLIWYYIVYILVLVACRRYAVSVIIAGFIFIFIGGLK